VFEGVDRCGKTTQCNKLMEYLKSRDVSTSGLELAGSSGCLDVLQYAHQCVHLIECPWE